MNPQTITLVRGSWAHVRPISATAAALFYDNLFKADPSLRSLFRSDLGHQGERLMRMLDTAVDKLDDLPALVPVLESLAVRHAGYGVRESHYRTVGAALLDTLAQGLGTAFTPAVRDAWASVYGVVSGVMIGATMPHAKAEG
jgi:hemoglobin-like flavoprotein